jgi:phenylalanyl-tRNA synthetase beta chain
MKISYNWIKQFIDIDWDAEKTGELLTDLGLEVEGIEKFETVKGGLKGVITGKVLEVFKHPNADKLSVTKVDLGDGKAVQIVCGATNVAAGQIVPVATIGTVLYDKEGNEFKIKKGKIRGEESYGMICAEDELGLGDSHDGIMVLDNSLETGKPVSEVFKIETDEVFEIGLTPNRADAMSHLGVARDLKAGLEHLNISTKFNTPSVSKFNIDSKTLPIQVEVVDKDKCLRYAGVTIKGVKVEKSPEWLQNRLKAIGLSPINNIVDITNYVMHELGQPLHAFDAEKIHGHKIIIKTAEKGDKLITLDGVERELHPDDLIIYNEKSPMVIAGVFGGIDSGVSDETTDIFIESAYFDPVTVRKAAKRHGLNTDSSFRFERGIDPDMTVFALKRAVTLIKEYAEAEIVTDIIDIYPHKIEPFKISLSYDYLNTLVGNRIDRNVVKNILASLEIKITSETDFGLNLEVPPYRVDVQRPADIVEEILRVYGYNQVEFSTKINASVEDSDKFASYKLENLVAELLRANGFTEIMSNSLTTPKYIDLSKSINKESTVHILNPLSQDLSVLRQSMLFSALESVVYNVNRKKSDLKLFEFGKVYNKYGEENYQEDKHLSICVTGNTNDENWILPNQPTDFYFIKGIVQSVMKRFGMNDYQVKPGKNSDLTDEVIFEIKKKKIVSIGKVTTKILNNFGLSKPVYFADFNWNNLLEVIKQTSKVTYKEIPRYPAVRRDLALELDKNVRFKDLYDTAFDTEKKILVGVDLFDVYEGDKIAAGKKSYALSFILQDKRKTLNDKQIDKTMQRIFQSFEKKFNAKLRK